MTFLAYVPARKNSKRLKNKNTKLLNGKPLIMHTLYAAQKSKYIKDIYISSDSPNIKRICIKNKFDFFNLRSKKYASDKTKMFDLIKYEYKKILKKKFNFKYLVLLQPTSPLRKYTDIDRACKLILKNKDVDCLVSTTNVNKKTESKKVMYSNGKMLSFTKKKNFIFPRLRNGPSILITNKKKLMKYLLGGKILDFKMSVRKSIDVDTQYDFNIAKMIYEKK
tara:strand:- start:13573 stop:14238 length:666 start_codon:yes stop_codon:yes gene_type:complete